MAGYDYDSWKSNNAIEAEVKGLMTAGRLAKRLGVSTRAVEEVAYPYERHHVSGAYNLVGYYDPTAITDAQLSRMRAADEAFHPYSLRSATVKWLEWPRMKIGRYSRRGRPVRPTEHEVAGCRVTYQSLATIAIYLPDGRAMTKRSAAKGLEVVDEAA